MIITGSLISIVFIHMNISSLSNGVGLLSMMCYSVSSCLTSTSASVLGNLCLVIMALLDILIDLRSS